MLIYLVILRWEAVQYISSYTLICVISYGQRTSGLAVGNWVSTQIWSFPSTISASFVTGGKFGVSSKTTIFIFPSNELEQISKEFENVKSWVWMPPFTFLCSRIKLSESWSSWTRKTTPKLSASVIRIIYIPSTGIRVYGLQKTENEKKETSIFLRTIFCENRVWRS